MNIAIIGCGKQAPKHISGLLASDAVKKIFVADLNVSQAEKLAANYDDGVFAMPIDEVFSGDAVDAVVIATPTPSHFPLCKKALENGKPFLVEKPLSSSFDEAKALADLSKTTGVPGMVGFIYRFAPVFDKIKTLVSDDADTAIGEARHAVFRIAGRGSDQPWKHQVATDGGAISEMMVHMIDLAVWYFGAAKEIKLCDSAIVRKTRMIGGKEVECDAEDWSVTQLIMKNGVRVLIQADMNSPVFRQFVEIDGDNGMIEGSIQGTFQDALTLFEARGGFEKGRQELDVKPGNFYIRQHECFLDMVKSGSDPERCSLDDAVEVMRIQIELKNQMAH